MSIYPTLLKPALLHPGPSTTPSSTSLTTALWDRLRRYLSLRLSPHSFLARRLHRASRGGRPIVLGTVDRPYERWLGAGRRGDRSPLEVLRARAGLDIHLTVGSARILTELPLLLALDQRNAVTVDVAVDLHAVDEALRTVARLAEQGVMTRLLLPTLTPDAASEEWLRRLFLTARDARASDIVPAPGDRSAASRLRLEYGFPRPQPGRG